MIQQFHWLSTGYCTALERISRRDGAWKQIQFPANFGLLQHAQHGWILFDTGYSMRFFEATREWPYRLYRMATPVFTDPEKTAAVQLSKMGVDPLSVRHILLSHFHGDHVGGLKDFPNAQFYCHRAALDQWRVMAGFEAVRHGILPALFPDDFETRCVVLDDSNALPDPFFGQKWDVLGDGTLEMPWLPGHGRGQLGLRFSTSEQAYFLVADAVWSAEAIQSAVLPAPIVRLFFDDWLAYRTTLNTLHTFQRTHSDILLIATHAATAI